MKKMITKQQVRAILATYEESRNNDNYLVEKLNIDDLNAKDINNIIRQRAIIQNEDNEFLPTDYKIRIFRQYKSLSAKIRNSYNPLLWHRYMKAKVLYNKIK